MTTPVALAQCITHSFHKLAQYMLSSCIFFGTPSVLLHPLLYWRWVQQNFLLELQTVTLQLQKYLYYCYICSRAAQKLLNSSSNSFSVNSGRVGLEVQLVVGACLSEINWSSLSSRKPCSSSISYLERFNITVAMLLQSKLVRLQTNGVYRIQKPLDPQQRPRFAQVPQPRALEFLNSVDSYGLKSNYYLEFGVKQSIN